MPKGVYERKPRKMSAAGIAALRKNMAKAREAARTSHVNQRRRPDTPAALEAKRRNAGKAVAIRTARAVLKHLPVGAAAGTVFQATRYRKLTVIDAAPMQSGEVWIQRFHQSGKIVIYGSAHEFDNECRIVWNYKPTLENIMEEPMFEEEEKK